MAFFHTGRVPATDRSALPPKTKGAGHTCPSLRTGKEQGLIRARAPGHGHRRERWPLFQTGNLAAEKEKPRSKAGGFPYGAKDGT